MLTERDEALLTCLSRRMCDEFGLGKVYFAQVFGKRRHYLAGCGEETFGQTHHVALPCGLAMNWQGDLSEEAQRQLHPVLERTLADMARRLAAQEVSGITKQGEA